MELIATTSDALEPQTSQCHAVGSSGAYHIRLLMGDTAGNIARCEHVPLDRATDGMYL